MRRPIRCTEKSSDVERCRALSSQICSRLKLSSEDARHFYRFRGCRVLSSAFGQLLEFPLDIEVLVEAELRKVPTKIAIKRLCQT